MTIKVAFMGVPVADDQAAYAWYERLIGRPPDMIPNDNEVVWQLSETGWLYVVHDAERAAGKALLTLIVDELDDYITNFNARGIAIESIEVDSGMYRKAVVTDPEGNTLNFAELIREESQP